MMEGGMAEGGEWPAAANEEGARVEDAWHQETEDLFAGGYDPEGRAAGHELNSENLSLTRRRAEELARGEWEESQSPVPLVLPRHVQEAWKQVETREQASISR